MWFPPNQLPKAYGRTSLKLLGHRNFRGGSGIRRVGGRCSWNRKDSLRGFRFPLPDLGGTPFARTSRAVAAPEAVAQDHRSLFRRCALDTRSRPNQTSLCRTLESLDLSQMPMAHARIQTQNARQHKSVLKQYKSAQIDSGIPSTDRAGTRPAKPSPR
jgi:hypothetical protein